MVEAAPVVQCLGDQFGAVVAADETGVRGRPRSSRRLGVRGVWSAPIRLAAGAASASRVCSSVIVRTGHRPLLANLSPLGPARASSRPTRLERLEWAESKAVTGTKRPARSARSSGRPAQACIGGAAARPPTRKSSRMRGALGAVNFAGPNRANQATGPSVESTRERHPFRVSHLPPNLGQRAVVDRDPHRHHLPLGAPRRPRPLCGGVAAGERGLARRDRRARRVAWSRNASGAE